MNCHDAHTKKASIHCCTAGVEAEGWREDGLTEWKAIVQKEFVQAG